MKRTGLVLIVLFLAIWSYSQDKNFIDQPYLETEAEVDSLVIPDKIFLTIILNESDSRDKKSTEELEILMQQVLSSLNIDTENDLSLLDISSDFKKYILSDQKVLKTKMYSLIVHDARTAGKVLAELEKVGVSNVSVEKTEFSDSENLQLKLKSLAVLKAKKNAESMLAPLNQKIGMPIFISDLNSISNQLQGKVAGIRIRGASSIYGSRASEPIAIDFDKIEFSVKVNVKFKIE
nr:SIMPL domain-containing protein [uncultured Draconibacterium sp.]